MDYGHWTLKQLKEECRKRKARVSGKKAQLVERLESYDRNQDFGSTDEQASEQYSLQLPEVTSYKDVNSDTVLPTVTAAALNSYLKTMDKSLDEKPKHMYREKFLLSLRASKCDTNVFIKARCAAEMRKNVSYNVDINIDKNGVITESQCDCGAGLGPEAHCKHFCTAIYALIDFSDTKSFIAQETCTGRLQTFHHTKKFKGSPLKAESLTLRKKSGNSSLEAMNDFDPRPVTLRRDAHYKPFFQNACINFSDSSMPILQLFPPANLYAVANDHDYLALHPEEQFLKEMGLVCVTDAYVEEIETKTRSQSKCTKWYTERSIRLPSSKFGRICKATIRTDFQQLASSLLSSNQVKAKSLEHGRKYESVAVKKYEDATKQQAKKCGLFIYASKPYLASSPDAVINENLLLEVKCPYTAKDADINVNTVPYLEKINSELRLKKDHDYYYQVQGQMLCANKRYCDFLVFTLKDVKILRIQRDQAFIETMVEKLASFYNNFFRSALLEKLFYKKYGSFTFDY